jgi:hypothetical protein
MSGCELSSDLKAFPRGVVVAALGARSLSALSGMSRLRELFFGVSIGCLTGSGCLRELKSLYLAAIVAWLLMSSRVGLRPPFSSLKVFSQLLSSSRRRIVSVATSDMFGLWRGW